MPPRKLLDSCPICGEPVYQDEDTQFEADREAGGRADPSHEACAIEDSDAMLDEYLL